jgi:hypothetical protein
MAAGTVSRLEATGLRDFRRESCVSARKTAKASALDFDKRKAARESPGLP